MDAMAHYSIRRAARLDRSDPSCRKEKAAPNQWAALNKEEWMISVAEISNPEP
jgi:hypothetical protein